MAYCSHESGSRQKPLQKGQGTLQKGRQLHLVKGTRHLEKGVVWFKKIHNMTKRLRGWKLEQAMAKQNNNASFEKGDQHSRLATALLSLWSHGKLSATTVRWLADCACCDGCQHDELSDIAKCGSFGQYPGNIHRDLLTRFVQDSIVPSATEVPVQCIDPKSLKKGIEEAAVFLPHILFEAMGALPNFENIFPTEHLEAFWNQAESTKDDRLENHPMKTKGWKRLTIPIFLHGDGAEYASRDSLMIWSWGALMTLFNSLESKFLIAAFPKSCTSESTWNDILKVVCWSLGALLKGLHPTHDWDGRPLQKGSPFYSKRGQQLCGGFKCVVWCIMGDAEFFANALHLPHWGSASNCWECDAKLANTTIGKWYKTIEVDKQEFVFVNNKAAAENPSSNHLLFHSLPGLTSKFVRGDALHILFVHGVHSHLLGSVLHFLCWKDGHGKQHKKPWERLGVVWEALQKVYKDLNSPTRLTNLKLSMFTNPKEPHTAYPSLNAKGSETKHLLPAMLVVCRSLLSTDVWLECCILEAMESLHQLVLVYDQADVFLTKSEWESAWNLAKGFWDTYAALNAWAKEENKKLFHIVYKHHSMLHLLYNSQYLYIKAHWCFSNEDFVGKVSLLTFSSSSGVRSTRLSAKMAPKYKILLSLLLTRDNFKETERLF